MFEEVQQLGIHLVHVGPGYTVWPTFHHSEPGSLDQLGGPESRRRDWQYAIRVAMNDQGGHIDALEILTKILMPGWHARESRRGRRAGGHVPASTDHLFADAFAQEDVRVVEVLEKLGKERIAVRNDRFSNAIKDAAIHSVGIALRLQQEGRDPRDDYGSAHALRAIFPEIACDFASTHREAGQDEITKIEMRDQFVQVLGEDVVVVPGCRLAGFAEPSAVISDNTITCSQKR